MKFLTWCIVGLLILLGVGTLVTPAKVTIHDTIILRQGETLRSVLGDFGGIKQYKVKYALSQRADEVQQIQPGNYQFSGSYTINELVDIFLQGPQQLYEHVTILEGWSKYDIDTALTSGGWIESGEYIAFIDDADRIARWAEVYDFLAIAIEERGEIGSLEGYLYPDTYYIDASKDFLQQLLTLQLQAFHDKVWRPHGAELRGMTEYVRSLGYGLRLSTYATLILASVIEKEEKVAVNKSPVASVFFNRLANNMLLGADITLCYGLERPYSACTPQVIVANLQDDTNPYNTRAVGGLPPTPIGNPSLETIRAVLDAGSSQYFYYLHEPNGTIHLAETLGQHNQNKATYLQ